ncbi:hypothetical protein CSB45_15365 [candidate division KSB3 bacterium]|uniref:Uncharacterized protein n=1 Tax=candidate division KSB3 bacterium TaxID=2044937 RepID=A0A2G6E0K6_9BACT|nr:MAG: hypothetical protein CSB45_15365 [candidate division KSB3 bacterium]
MFLKQEKLLLEIENLKKLQQEKESLILTAAKEEFQKLKSDIAFQNIAKISGYLSHEFKGKIIAAQEFIKNFGKLSQHVQELKEIAQEFRKK